MEENKIDWVECKIGIDQKGKFRLDCPCKDDIPKALGYLIRMSMETTKGLLLDEAAKVEQKGETEDESSDEN